MVNAGRILIIAKGAWDSLTSYEQLDLVTRNDTAYLARQGSVGVDPATDTAMTYWQPFGTTSIESVMPSSHLILCRPLLLLPPIPPSIRVFSNESTFA